VVKTAIRLHM